jgi:acyl carrier protein
LTDGKSEPSTQRAQTLELQPPESSSGSCVSISAVNFMVCSGLQMSDMTSVKEQLKPIILKSLRITDLTPDDLRDDQPLLGGELEIDSIDILQLVLEIERHFNIKLVQANFNQKALESVNALAAVIESKVAEART